MKGVIALCLVVLTLASGCTNRGATPTPKQSSLAQPVPLPSELQQKKVPLVAASLHVGQGGDDTTRVFNYLQSIGGAYIQAWIDYLGAPRPVFHYIRVRQSQATQCLNGKDVYTAAPDMPRLLACLDKAKGLVTMYVPVGTTTSAWASNGRTETGEMVASILVAEAFGRMIFDYLESARSLGSQMGAEARSLAAVCLGGVTFRAAHNQTEAQVREAYGQLNAEAPNAFIAGYMDGQPSQCYGLRK